MGVVPTAWQDEALARGLSLWGGCIVLMFDLAAVARSESLSWNRAWLHGKWMGKQWQILFWARGWGDGGAWWAAIYGVPQSWTYSAFHSGGLVR